MLNLNEFVDYYASANETSKAEAKRNITTFVDTFKSATLEKGGVNLVGFLKSEVTDVPAKKGRNPRDGSVIDIPAKKVVKVKVASKFKNLTED